MSNNRVLCGIGCGVCCLLVVLIIVICSVGTVEPIEYGIIYNSITKSVNTEMVYSGGWYFIGPIQSFFVFPSTMVNIDFTDFPDAQHPPMEVKDSIGQTVTLSFSIQYRLQQENIGELYHNYQQNYLNVFLSKIDNSIRQRVGAFDSTMFWSNREQAGKILREAINVELQKMYANCTNIQIINVKLPATKEAQLVTTQVTKQMAQTKTMEQRAKEIRSGISVNASLAERNITIIQGQAQSDAKQILAAANSNATNIEITATGDAFLQLQTKLGLTNGLDLDQFIYYSDLQTADEASFALGVKNSITGFGK